MAATDSMMSFAERASLLDFRNLTRDHIVAREIGGQDVFDNLQLMCGACNSKKGTKPMAEFIQQLEAEGLRPKGVPFVAPYTLMRD